MGSQFEQIGKKFKEAMVNPELNRVKAEVRDALKKAKEDPENSDISSIVLQRGLVGLRADLAELGVDQGQWGSFESIYKKRYELATSGLKNEAILESLEAQNLSAFVSDYAQYSKLDAVIAESKAKRSKKPLNRFVRVVQASAPLLATLGAGFMAYLKTGKKGKGEAKPSKLDKIAAKADAVLTRENKTEKKEKKKKEEEARHPDAAPASSTRIYGGAGEDAPEYVDTKAESVGSVTYEMNPDHTKEKLTPAQFRKKYLAITDRVERNKFVLSQVPHSANNIFEKLKVKGKTGMTVEFEVDRTGLRVAGMPVQLDKPTAIAASMLSDCILPTPWVVDQTYKAAKAKGGKVDFIAYKAIADRLGIPHSKAYQKVFKKGKWVETQNGDLMMSAQFAVTRAEMLKEQRRKKGIADDAFQAGHFKSIVNGSANKRNEKQVVIYGARAKGRDTRIQPVTNVHVANYSDYSHQLRRLRNGPKSVTVTAADGSKKQMSYIEFNANKAYGTEFGFAASQLKKPKVGTELQAFVDQNKKGQDKKAPTAVAGSDKPDNKKKKTA